MTARAMSVGAMSVGVMLAAAATARAESRATVGVQAAGGADAHDGVIGFALGGALHIDDVMLEAALPLRHELDGGGGLAADHATQLGALRVGARYIAVLGPLEVAPSVTLWWPAADAGDDVRWSYLDGTRDARAFLAQGAFAPAVSLAYRWRCGYAAVEGGAALVTDDRLEIDNVFASAGAGGYLRSRFSLQGAVRVDAFPHVTLVYPSVALGYDVSRTTVARVSVAPVLADSGSGAALVADVTWRVW